MALHKARGTSHSYDLREISPGLLSRFLLPYAQYLKSNGIVLPDADNKISLPDYQKLSFIIAAPDAATPRELINSLHCIREVATTETLNCLLEEAATRGILIDNNPDMTPIDVAMQVWMHDRRIIECLHVEKFLIKPCIRLLDVATWASGNRLAMPLQLWRMISTNGFKATGTGGGAEFTGARATTEYGFWFGMVHQ